MHPGSFQVRTRIKLKLDEKILSNDVGDLDDLFTAGVMSDVIEESTKEALEVEPENGGQGSSGKASGPKSSEPDKNTTAKGIGMLRYTVENTSVTKCCSYFLFSQGNFFG